MSEPTPTLRAMATALGREAMESHVQAFCLMMPQDPRDDDKLSKATAELAWANLTEAARLWEERRVLLRTIRVLRVLSYDRDFACGRCGECFGDHAPDCELVALLGRGTG